MKKLEQTIDLLLSADAMPPKYRDHPLRGNFVGYRECHVDGEGDWLLIYKKHEDLLVLVFTATDNPVFYSKTSTHSAQPHSSHPERQWCVLEHPPAP